MDHPEICGKHKFNDFDQKSDQSEQLQYFNPQTFPT